MTMDGDPVATAELPQMVPPSERRLGDIMVE